jgi:hypothetical protein
MKRTLVTAAALVLLAATAAAAVQVTASEARLACLPPAVIQAWS